MPLGILFRNMRDTQVAVTSQGLLVHLEWMSNLVRCSVWVPVAEDAYPDPNSTCTHEGREYVRADREDRFKKIWALPNNDERHEYVERVNREVAKLAPAAFAECFPWLACQSTLRDANPGWADFEVAAAYEHLYHEEEV